MATIGTANPCEPLMQVPAFQNFQLSRRPSCKALAHHDRQGRREPVQWGMSLNNTDVLITHPNAVIEEINEDPKKAGITYQRHECQRCHIGVRGPERRADFRGMCCSACQVLYCTDVFYMIVIGTSENIAEATPVAR